MNYDRAAILVKKASLEFDKAANPLLAEYDLTGSQYKILKYLYEHEDKQVRQVDLERYYSLTNPTTIGLLDNLEKKGFVVRAQNPDDARSRVIKLTEKSVSMREELERLGDKLEDLFTSALTERERNRLTELLKKLLTGFNK